MNEQSYFWKNGGLQFMGIFFDYIDDFERLFTEENKNATKNTNNSTEIENNFKYRDDNMIVPEIVLDIIDKMKDEKNAKEKDHASNLQ